MFSSINFVKTPVFLKALFFFILENFRSLTYLRFDRFSKVVRSFRLLNRYVHFQKSTQAVDRITFRVLKNPEGLRGDFFKQMRKSCIIESR